ncbi:hypothetical protein IFR05_012872 [Cadophora sp. M221]|nr:hypothetical protein IFR05_012872 [Cadophora sp. M221]
MQPRRSKTPVEEQNGETSVQPSAAPEAWNADGMIKTIERIRLKHLLYAPPPQTTQIQQFHKLLIPRLRILRDGSSPQPHLPVKEDQVKRTKTPKHQNQPSLKTARHPNPHHNPPKEIPKTPTDSSTTATVSAQHTLIP